MKSQQPKRQQVKKNKEDLKIANTPDLGAYDLSVPRGLDPRVKELPNWELYKKKQEREQKKRQGIQLPPV